jgi:hypothetical protein
MRFAHLKIHHGFERMRLRGLSRARDEFHLTASLQNPKRVRSGHEPYRLTVGRMDARWQKQTPETCIGSPDAGSGRPAIRTMK